MNMSNQEELAQYCKSLVDATAQAQAWVKDSTLVRSPEQLQAELRKAGRAYRRCTRAASRKMCAGVFGPSQAGKSYLLSALARDADGRLTACFCDRELDFIGEINPAGGKESTGLVTRFTLTPDNKATPAYPVHLTLLSETDLVKIFANTFYADFKQKGAVDEEKISEALNQLENRASAAENNEVSIDDIEDLREYMDQNFSNEARVQILGRRYWSRAARLAPRLSVSDRISLYAVIWNNVNEFSAALRDCLHALKDLGFADELYCGLDALTPREQSIIDVATLKTDDSMQLTSRTPSGREVTLSRRLVTALTAELTIVMKACPADFFNHTDLLDFPGYRSRMQYADAAEAFENEPNLITELFLRGKVAYLFQRYCAERELTSMLLCVGPGPQEVRSLPEVINKWISETHGSTPEKRMLTKQDSLFLVLTKFDMEFEDKAGETDGSKRWENRLQASLLNFFTGSQWPKEWKPHQPFNNIYLLRNPNFKFLSVMKYDGPEDAQREVGVIPEREGFVKKLRESFLSSELVKQHFRSPEDAWNAAMKLNDGGITYIRDNLSPLCDPEIKLRQIALEINGLNARLATILGTYYTPEDKKDVEKAKETFFFRLLPLMLPNPKNPHASLRLKDHFGEFLRSFNMETLEIVDLYEESYRQYLKRKETEAAATETEPESEEEIMSEGMDLLKSFSFDGMDGMDGGSDLSAAQPAAAQDAPADVDAASTQDEYAAFADDIMSTWEHKLSEVSQSERAQNYFGLNANLFAQFVEELSVAAKRLSVRGELARRFREIAGFANLEKKSIVMRQAACASTFINNFVSWLGKGPNANNQKQHCIWQGKEKEVFTSPAPVDDLPDLPKLANYDTAQDYAVKYAVDWMFVYHEQLLLNVYEDQGAAFDVEKNAMLGKILSVYKTVPNCANVSAPR